MHFVLHWVVGGLTGSNPFAILLVQLNKPFYFPDFPQFLHLLIQIISRYDQCFIIKTFTDLERIIMNRKIS